MIQLTFEIIKNNKLPRGKIVLNGNVLHNNFYDFTTFDIKPKVGSNVLEITFNKYGIVQSKKLYNIDNMNDLRRIKTSTNKTYKSNSYIEKVLTSVKQKIDAPKLKRKKK